MMIISRLDKILKRIEEEAESTRVVIRALQSSSAVGSPKPVAPEAERFYVANGKHAVGPHDREKLIEMFRRQILTARSLVCKEGDTHWQELSNVIKTSTPFKFQ